VTAEGEHLTPRLESFEAQRKPITVRAALDAARQERHIRHLAPLAFVSPRIVEAIANGIAPADLTVTRLARALPHGWAAQEHKLGISEGEGGVGLAKASCTASVQFQRLGRGRFGFWESILRRKDPAP
jgi:hypothetical protein